MIPGCARHAALVARATGPDATDADLAAYATEVPGCSACSRLLTVDAGVLPRHLAEGSDDERGAIAARVRLDSAGTRRLAAALEPARPWKTALAVIALAAAAALVFGLARSPEPTAIAPPTPGSIASADPGAMAHPDRVEHALEAADPRLPSQESDAVADAAWPLPDFEELRASGAKASGALTLELSLDPKPGVGSSTRLTVASSAPTAVTVCVSGAETGVVWRGGVPTGPSILTRSGRAVRYRFDRAGRYRFVLSLGDDPLCSTPVDRVEVIL